ncbi:MAG TPA: response regulator [Chloroflexaceae bacterium]|nr:response regulator [Chloroflexaceae bacterium]
MAHGEEESRGDAAASGLLLVIDDDQAILETVAEILADEGYRVMTARNGAEGLAAVERELPELVLLDRWMPVLDGHGFWQGLQQRGLEVPIIAMTAAHDVEPWAQGLRAAGVLPKPFRLPALLDLVAEVLGPR